MTIGFLVPAGISVIASSLLVVRASRSLPRLPVVELAILSVLVTTLLTFGFVEAGSEAPRGIVATSTAAWLLLLFTYPDGKIVPAWSVAVLAGGLAGIGAGAVLPEPRLLLVAFGIAFAVGFAGQVWRYRRRSSVAERQATKWALVGLIPATAVFLGIGLLASTTSLGTEALEHDWYFGLSTVAIWTVPWCAAIGVLAPERGRVDPVIHALVAGCGALFLLAWMYFLLEPGVGPRWAAAFTVALVLPAWWGWQRIATRLVYGRDPGRALASLGVSLERTPQPADVAALVANAVVDGLAVPYAAVTLESGQEHAVGTPTAAAVEGFPVRHAGELMAIIAVAPRRGELHLATRDRGTLEQLAVSAGPALHAAVTLERLQAAREGLVLAREEERRRIRRDLHDDLAPTLAALGLRAASASALLDTDHDRARELFRELQDGITAAVGRLREIAYDLRPPILDDLGLVAAIRDRVGTEASRSPHVVILGEIEDERIPAAVQLAALRIVQEAVANVRSHASASTCTVELVVDEDCLVVRVNDDGSGIPPDAKRGLGSRSIEERATELGGRASRSSSSSGTTIEAWLPLRGSAT